MKIKNLKLKNFRNYEVLDLELGLISILFTAKMPKEKLIF